MAGLMGSRQGWEFVGYSQEDQGEVSESVTTANMSLAGERGLRN